ncbi:hypothetical protein HY312_04410 [Candidatus Saccharibacteria bacterium]|nr:hypothetical protein [Candidatus Saccharibacteria bacterium]
MPSRGVEARIVSHINGSDSSCLIIGNDMRSTLVGARMESFTIGQLKNGLSSLVQKGELTHCLTDYGAREYRLTEKGRLRAEKLKKAKKAPLWV